MKRKLLILPLFFYFGFIYLLSSIHQDNLPKFTIYGIDKVIHIFEFAIYSFLVGVALEAFNYKNYRLKKIIIAFIFTALFAAFDELHQYFVLGRSASVYDFIADLIGGIIGLFLFQKFNITDKLQNVNTKKIKNN